jgi:LysM repeat protein
MASRTSLIILVFSFGATMGIAQKNSVYMDYIDSYKVIAISEMERTGIPASIKMAQAILESNAGQSDLARKANNHFGIKCSGDWDGKTYKKIDDDRDRRGRPIKSCFRKYSSALESYKAHSDFLRTGSRQGRYSFLFELDITDYKGWAKGLKRAGYATSPTYHRKLIDLIERYELYRLDEMASVEILVEQEKPEAKKQEPEEIDLFPEPVSPSADGRKEPLVTKVGYHNDVKNVIANRDETVARLAKAADIDLDHLLEYNENLHSGNQIVPAGTRVYMQKKRKSFRGKQSWHKVEKGETMIDLSIAYGIRLEDLYERNLLKPGLEPADGTLIKLRGGTVDTPPLTSGREKDRPAEIVMEEETPVLDIEIVGNGKSEEAEGRDSHSDEITEDPFGSSSSSSGNKAGRKEEARQESDPPLLPPIIPEKPAPKKKEQVPAAEENSDAASGGNQPERIREDPFGKPAKSEVGATYYVVQQGDTLWSISRRYDTTVEEIKQLNNLSDNTIRRGMMLRVK